MSDPLPSLVFDFDSTLVTAEGIDELFAFTLDGVPDREDRLLRFRKLTEQGMAGEIGYEQSLRDRLALLDATRGQVEEIGKRLTGLITPSVRSRRRALAREADRIWVVSGGFEELIRPVVIALGLRMDHLYAHRFVWNEAGRISGVDPRTLIAQGGKPAVLRETDIPRPLWVIGDGATDLELRELGLADRFFAFAGNRHRPVVTERADAVLSNLNELPSLD